MSEWTDEQRAAVIEEYKAAEPTPENSMDIVKELAEKYDKTPNGVRMILMKDESYVKKTPEKSSGSKSSGGSKRVSKADAQNGLTEAIEAAGAEVDEDIISKLTGKAAVYFTEVVNSIKS